MTHITELRAHHHRLQLALARAAQEIAEAEYQVARAENLVAGPVRTQEYALVRGRYDGRCSEACHCREQGDVAAELRVLFPERYATPVQTVARAAGAVRGRLAAAKAGRLGAEQEEADSHAA